MQCRVCDHNNLNPSLVAEYPDRNEKYYRCSSCRSIFLYPLPETDLNLAFSGDEAAERRDITESKRKNYFYDRLSLINNLTAPGNLLEIGCGAGYFLRAASEKGWRVSGVELSPELSSRASENNPEAVIYTGDFLSIKEIAETQYRFICALDVLEHVTNPEAMINRCAQLLEKDGILLIQTPNALSLRARITKKNWNMLNPDYHFHLYSGKALTETFKKNGLSLLNLSTASGVGEERGFRKAAMNLRQYILSILGLGNALLALAKKKNL